MTRLRLTWMALVIAFSLSAFTQYNPLVQRAEGMNANTALAAASTYVSLRLINAALSTAQEVEVSASLGVGGSAQPLKILEPVDDTVERAADVVFALALITGTLAIGLGPIAAIGAGVTALGCAAQALCLRHAIWTRVLTLGLVTTIALPGTFWIGGGLATLMTHDAQAEAQTTLDSITQTAQALIEGDADAVPETDTASDDGWWMQRLYNNTADAVSETSEALRRYRDSVSYFMSNAEALFSALLVLMGAFVLQAIALPLVLLAFVWGILRR